MLFLAGMFVLKLEQAKDASYTYNKTYRCYDSSLSNLTAMSKNVGLVIFLIERSDT